MAMLAERRQRKRYNLVPRGKALYEDESRFGTKMLERMGWKKGEGLGANLHGSKDFVRIRYKNDVNGLGYENRDDQWTQHEQSFNGLLKTLNNEETAESRNKENVAGNDSEDEMPIRVGFGFHDATAKKETTSKSEKLKEKISGISLEERSKQSKARVHYKKFTKGKDLAQYSEKDLANIFGKKAVDEQQEINDFYKNLNNAFGIIGEETSGEQLNETGNGFKVDQDESSAMRKNKKKKKKDQNKEQETNTAIQEDKQNNNSLTYTSNLSVHEYFKLKMQAFKNRITTINNVKELDNSCNEETKEVLKKKKKKSKTEIPDLESEVLQEPAEKNSKKNNKSLEQINVSESEMKKEEEIVEKKKKSKKRNIEVAAEAKLEVENSVNDFLQEPAEKKSKKNKTNSDHETLIGNENVQDAEKDCLEKPADKKTKKNKNKSFQEMPSGNETEKASKSIQKEKKSKKQDTEESTERILEATISEVIDLKNYCLRREPAKRNTKKSQNMIDLEGNFSENERELKMVSKENKIENVENVSEKIKHKKKKNKSKKNDLSIEEESARKRKLGVSDTEITKTVDIQEINLTQETTKKKKNKNLDKEIITIIDSDDDEYFNTENQPLIEEKIKSKTIKSLENDTSANEDKSAISNPDDVSSDPAKNCKKTVSSTDKNISTNNVDFQVIDLEELKKKYEAFNIYQISTFCAEKFRYINLNVFEGSSLSQIEGYGLSSDIRLDVVVSKYDEERITKLWKCALNKYEKPDKPMKTYQTYVREAIAARRTKQRPRKLNVKTWKRKNAFNF